MLSLSSARLILIRHLGSVWDIPCGRRQQAEYINTSIFRFLFKLFIRVLVSYLHNIKNVWDMLEITTVPFLSSCSASLLFRIHFVLILNPPFLYPLFPVPRPLVLNLSSPQSLYSSIPPVLNPSFPSYLISFIPTFLPFLLPSFPASHHYCLPPFQHLSCSSSLLSSTLLSCIPQVLNHSFYVSLRSWILLVLNHSLKASLLSCNPHFLHN